jgi:predicted GH43/DUF377 family glycosyl hydrolase
MESAPAKVEDTIPMKFHLPSLAMLSIITLASAAEAQQSFQPAPSGFKPATPVSYPDKRPGAHWRLDAADEGVVLKHGDGPGKCDMLGARDVWVYEADGTYYMHYDGAGPKGWLACLATSKDLRTWEKKGPVLDFGKPGEEDSASASYGVKQVENSSLYFEPSNKTWFLFTNHIGLEGHEFTDAVWVYWTKDLNKWNADHKAVVLDGRNCKWSHACIGLPSVIKVGNRLAMFYDAPGGDSKSHMKRDVGLAWLQLPLTPPPASVKP